MRPLNGIKVIEMAGLAPSSYCGMLLSDFGASVVIVDRLSTDMPESPHIMSKNPFDRGKRSMRINLKTEQGVEIATKMISRSDVIFEPYRPGVMEKLELGPDKALKINPKLIYARLTGWGQSGPYASLPGHDINYIGLSGALSLFKRKGGKPLPPCNILGDFAGGGMLCAMGILLALIERNNSGKGQVVDAAMLDGVANLSTFFYGLFANHLMSLEIGTNILDSGAPYYQTYETADGKYMTVGAIEGKFYANFLDGLGLDSTLFPQQNNRKLWPKMRRHFAEVFKTKTRDEWTTIFKGKDACVAPVLELNEVDTHPHNREREILIFMDGLLQPAPAPKLSRTPGKAIKMGDPRGSHTREVLKEIGYTKEKVMQFIKEGVIE